MLQLVVVNTFVVASVRTVSKTAEVVWSEPLLFSNLVLFDPGEEFLCF